MFKGKIMLNQIGQGWDSRDREVRLFEVWTVETEELLGWRISVYKESTIMADLEYEASMKTACFNQWELINQ